MAKLKAGDKFIFHKCKANKIECATDDLTIGKIYTLYASVHGLSFDDDTGDERDLSLRIDCYGMKVTKIRESK